MKKQKCPDGSNWKKILNEIYNHSPNSWCESNKCSRNNDNHPIAKKLKINGQELMLGISFLENHKLIKTEVHNSKEFWASWELTGKGFNIALENQKQKNSERLQEIIAIGTVLVASITFFNFLKLPTVLDLKQKILVYGFLGFILVLVITMVGIIWPIIRRRTDEWFSEEQ